MCVAQQYFFGHSVCKCARSLNAFHYKTSMRISHEQKEQRERESTSICVLHNLIFLCVRQAEKVIVLMPTYTLHSSILAAVSTASTAVALYRIHILTYNSSEAILDIYLHTHTHFHMIKYYS